jgi:hypothetical protein
MERGPFADHNQAWARGLWEGWSLAGGIRTADDGNG